MIIKERVSNASNTTKCLPTIKEDLAKNEPLDEEDVESWPVEIIEEYHDENVFKKEEEEEVKEEESTKGYNCAHCSFKTLKLLTLNMHVERKHNEDKETTKHANKEQLKGQMRKCPHCPFKTDKYPTLYSHVKRKHRKDLLETIENKVESKSRKKQSDDKLADNTMMPQDQIIVEEDDYNDDDDDNEAEEENKEATVADKNKTELAPSSSTHTSSSSSSSRNKVLTRRSRRKKRLLYSSDPLAIASIADQCTGYACHYCTFVAATVVSINAHNAREHSNVKPALSEVPVSEYDCDQCEYKSSDRRNMQIHLKEHALRPNEEGIYTCNVCLYETNSKMGLQRHVSIKHNKPRREAAKLNVKAASLKCQECDFKCLNAKTMDWHKRQHNNASDNADEGKNYQCNDCDFSTWTKDKLYCHIKRKHKEEAASTTTAAGARPHQTATASGNDDAEAVQDSYPCEQCDHISRNKHSLKVHVIRKHTSIFNHECDTCGKKFKVKADLTNHIRFQHREQPIICEVCGKTCRNSNLLYLHQKFAHYKPDFECHICHRRMVSQANLDEHIHKQHGQRDDVVCDECGKTFSKQIRLKIHKRVHTGMRPYACKVCNKAFARRNGLRQHLLIHTGQRPYVCDICGKAFTQKTGLISHRKSHPGNHPPLPRVTIDHVLSDFIKDDES